jgi:hypothetical protein
LVATRLVRRSDGRGHDGPSSARLSRRAAAGRARLHQQISAEAQRAEADIAAVAAVGEQSSAFTQQVSASTQETSA